MHKITLTRHQYDHLTDGIYKFRIVKDVTLVAIKNKKIVGIRRIVNIGQKSVFTDISILQQEHNLPYCHEMQCLEFGRFIEAHEIEYIRGNSEF